MHSLCVNIFFMLQLNGYLISINMITFYQLNYDIVIRS